MKELSLRRRAGTGSETGKSAVKKKTGIAKYLRGRLPASLLAAVLAGTAGAVSAGEPERRLAEEAFILPFPMSEALWIHSTADRYTPVSQVFRTVVKLDAPVKHAELLMICDVAAFLVNGKRVPNASTAGLRVFGEQRFVFTKFLKPGENVLAFRHLQRPKDKMIRPFLMRGVIETTDGRKISLVSKPSLFRCSQNPEAGWEKPGFDDSKWARPAVWGDLTTPPWNPMGDVIRNFSTPEEFRRWRAAWKKGIELPPQLAKEPEECRAQVVYSGLMTGYEINGKLVPPVHLMPMQAGTPAHDSQIRRLAEAGVQIFEYRIQLDDLPYDQKTGRYRLESVDEQIRRVLHLAPEGYLILQLPLRRLVPLLKQYPDEVTGYASGAPQGIGVDELLGRPLRFSLASEVFRREGCRLIDQLAEFVRSKPWKKRIVGFRICAGLYVEWAYFGLLHDMPDTGKPMTAAFRKWLEKTYKTDAALQKAWHDPSVTLRTATVPNADERVGTKGYLLDPSTRDRKTMDYYECHSYERDKTLLTFCRAVKRNFPTRLCGAYYGYPIGSLPSSCGITDSDRVLASPDVDFISRPYGYGYETRNAGGTGLHAHQMSIVRKHRKLSIIEADIRSHYVHPDQPGERRRRCKSKQETLAVFRRDLGNALTLGAGIQFFEVNAYANYPMRTYDAPEILETIRQGIGIWRRLFKEPPTRPAGSIALVLNTDDRRRHGYPNQKKNQLMALALWQENITALVSCGHAVDIWSSRDFLREKPKYPVVFMNMPFTFTDAERREWYKLSDQKGVTTFWPYAPGLVTPAGFSDAAMKELTGIGLKARWDAKPLMEINTDDGSRLLIRTGNRTKGTMDSPRVEVTDKEAQILGRWRDDGRPALARKKLPGGGTSLFCGVPVCNRDYLMKLLADTGSVPILSGSGYAIANSRLVNVSLYGNQTRTVTLPAPASEVKELFTGRVWKGPLRSFEITTGKEPEAFLFEYRAAKPE